MISTSTVTRILLQRLYKDDAKKSLSKIKKYPETNEHEGYSIDDVITITEDLIICPVCKKSADECLYFQNLENE